MSDDSVISEDIESVFSGSEPYNPGEDDYENDTFSVVDTDFNSQSFRIPPTNKKKDVFYSGKQNDAEDDYQEEYSANFDEDNDKIKYNLAKERGKAVEYSEDFEEEQSKIFKAYSEDFEEEQSKIYSENFEDSKSSIFRQENKKFNAVKKSVAALPSLDLQSLQAEQALQVLGKEVVKLRNRQREILKVRQTEAKDKKLRAEERRAKYTEELLKNQALVKDLQNENVELKSRIQGFESNILSLEETKVILQDTIKSAEDSLQKQRLQIESLQNTVNEKSELYQKLVAELDQHKALWNQEKNELKALVMKKEMMLEVAHKSIESTETRMTREKENLPSHHKQLLEDRLAHIIAKEIELNEREGILRADEQRFQSRMDVMRREVTEEMTRLRERSYQDMAEERASLVRLQQSLQTERSQIIAQQQLEKLDNDAKRMDLLQREGVVEKAEREVARKRGELEAAERLIGPHIRVAEEEREKLNSERQILLQREQEIERKLSNIFEINSNLQKREKELQLQYDTLQQEKRNGYNQTQMMRDQWTRIQKETTRNREERLGLHKVSVELARQMNILHQSVAWFAHNNNTNKQYNSFINDEHRPSTYLEVTNNYINYDSAPNKSSFLRNKQHKSESVSINNLYEILQPITSAVDALLTTARLLGPPIEDSKEDWNFPIKDSNNNNNNWMRNVESTGTREEADISAVSVILANAESKLNYSSYLPTHEPTSRYPTTAFNNYTHHTGNTNKNMDSIDWKLPYTRKDVHVNEPILFVESGEIFNKLNVDYSEDIRTSLAEADKRARELREKALKYSSR